VSVASRSAPKLEGDEVRFFGDKNAHLKHLPDGPSALRGLTRPIAFWVEMVSGLETVTPNRGWLENLPIGPLTSKLKAL